MPKTKYDFKPVMMIQVHGNMQFSTQSYETLDAAKFFWLQYKLIEAYVKNGDTRVL